MRALHRGRHVGGRRNRGEQGSGRWRRRLGKCGYWVRQGSQSVGCLALGWRPGGARGWQQCWLSQRRVQTGGSGGAQGAQLISTGLGRRQGGGSRLGGGLSSGFWWRARQPAVAQLRPLAWLPAQPTGPPAIPPGSRPRAGGRPSLVVGRQVAPAHAVLGGQVVRAHGATAAVGIQLGLHAPLLNLLRRGGCGGLRWGGVEVGIQCSWGAGLVLM